MDLLVKDEIAYGVHTGAVFYNPGSNRVTQPNDKSFNNAAWSIWGDDNLEPDRMKDDIENCGVLSGVLEVKARMAIGKGLDPFILTHVDADGTETLEYVNDSEIIEWLDKNKTFLYSYSNMYNMIAYGWGATQFVLSRDRKKINRIAATDINTTRLEKKNPTTGFINNIYLCADWSTAPAIYDADKIKRVQVLLEGYELEDLQDSNSGKEFCVLHRLLKNGNIYYPKPLWKAAQAWVDVTRAIPEMKNALHDHVINAQYVIIISETYWKRIHKKWDSYTPEQRQEVIASKNKEINDFLAGHKNAGKSITAGRYYDPLSKQYENDIAITVLDDKMKDGKLLPDSAAADKQIAFANFFNPAIFGGNLLGDGASGGAGSGSDIREAYLVQLMLMHQERMLNLDVFNLVKYYNGWQKKYANKGLLTFRYKTEVLKTLDSGGSLGQMNEGNKTAGANSNKQ